MAPRVFITGATGYIGGDALFRLSEVHPEYEITCLVRDSDKGAKVASQYSQIRLVYGNLDSDELLTEEAKKADVVLDCASADHEGALKSITQGLSSHEKERPGFLVHTSGTGILCWADVERKTFGQAASKVYDDWDGVNELTSLPDFAPHRNVDKVVLKAGTENTDIVRTAIVCPPCIYGKGRGPANQRSIQLPELTKCTLQEKQGFQVEEGKALWNHVHVHDLSDCYVKLIEAAVAGGDNATWGPEGYYLIENGAHVWGDVAKAIAAETHKQGLISTNDIRSVGPEEADRLTSHASLLFGANSRGTAIRARKVLGWSPKGTGILEEIPDLIKEEARSLGLIQGHAAQVAG